MSKEREYLTAIRKFCKECMKDPYVCKNVKCHLYNYRDASLVTQLTFFNATDKEIFLTDVLNTAKKFQSSFYWSELRKKVGIEPIEPNWWGCAAKVMRGNGFRIIPGFKKSQIKQRKGYDKQWKKIT